MLPKYAAVNGNLGVERRCAAYASGPWRTAKDVRNNIDPTVQLIHPVSS